MAGKNEIKATVRLDGGAQFKKDLTDVNKNLKHRYLMIQKFR